MSRLGAYSPDSVAVGSFLEKLKNYCAEHAVELFLVSGYSEVVADRVAVENSMEKYFDKDHFLRVNDAYVSSKSEMDRQMYDLALSKDPDFVDGYFKQVVIQQVLAEKGLKKTDALLLCNDIWVDGYYTRRFSGIDFALYEGNLCDRGKPTGPVIGLAYFNLEINSVVPLIENFPQVNFGALEKYIFDSMQKALIGDEGVESLRKSMEKKKFGGD